MSQICWRTPVAHHPTEDTRHLRCVAEFSRIGSRRRLAAPRARRQRRALALGGPARRTPGHTARRGDQRWLAPGVMAIAYSPSPTSIGVPAVWVAVAIGVTVPGSPQTAT